MRSRMREIDIVNRVLPMVTIIALVLIIINSVIGYIWNVKISTYNIVISGENPMKLYQGDEYVEPGYTAYDYQNNEVKEKVAIVNSVDTNKVGEYRVVYTIQNFFKKNTVIREVNVLENPLEFVKFSLKGDNTITVERTVPYQELGYTVESDQGDFTENVTIKNTINTAKVGTYEVVYTLKIGNKEKSIKRIVNVTGDKYVANVTNTAPTNQGVNIRVESFLKDFSHFIDPNGAEMKEEAFEFPVSENGTYVFHLYDVNKVDTVIQVNVTNIDKKGPAGVCTAAIGNNKTTYKVEATDENGIGKYVHNEKEYTTNTFVIDKVEDNGSVDVYDTLGNLTNIPCILEYEYIGPTNDNYMYKYDSSTLKYWIENSSDYYKTTHIWVKDPYNQMKVAIPSKIGSLFAGKSIINNEIKNKGYANKGMVAINASSIVGGGFGTKFVNLNPSWVGTAEIPLVINDGKIIRDSTGIEFPDVGCITYVMKKNGYLGYYLIMDGKNVASNSKIKEEIINEGIKYTFGFWPILVWDGKVQSTDKGNNIRQAICQINRNNFLIVTNTTSDRGSGFSFKGLGEYMVKNNCWIGFNLDGGGSVNFYYKGNTNSLSSIKSSNRGLVDMLYFVEQ